MAKDILSMSKKELTRLEILQKAAAKRLKQGEVADIQEFALDCLIRREVGVELCYCCKGMFERKLQGNQRKAVVQI